MLTINFNQYYSILRTTWSTRLTINPHYRFIIQSSNAKHWKTYIYIYAFWNLLDGICYQCRKPSLSSLGFSYDNYHNDNILANIAKMMTLSFFISLGTYRLIYLLSHPWAGEDLSLKIDDHDQTIWICILEL